MRTGTQLQAVADPGPHKGMNQAEGKGSAQATNGVSQKCEHVYVLFRFSLRLWEVGFLLTKGLSSSGWELKDKIQACEENNCTKPEELSAHNCLQIIRSLALLPSEITIEPLQFLRKALVSFPFAKRASSREFFQHRKSTKSKRFYPPHLPPIAKANPKFNLFEQHFFSSWRRNPGLLSEEPENPSLPQRHTTGENRT